MVNKNGISIDRWRNPRLVPSYVPIFLFFFLYLGLVKWYLLLSTETRDVFRILCKIYDGPWFAKVINGVNLFN